MTLPSDKIKKLMELNGKTIQMISDVVPIRVEKLTDQKYRFQTVGSVANIVNGNNRIIPLQVQRDAVQDQLQQKWQLTSYINHPDPSKGDDIRGNPEDIAGIPEIVELNDKGETVVNIRTLGTEKGAKIQQLFDEGVELGVSQRALGVQSVREDDNGDYYIIVDKIVKILGYDFCYLDSAAAGERTRLRLLDTVELDMILNSKRIEDTFQMEDIMDPKLLLEQNQKLVAAVTVLVDTIKTQMDKNSGEMPKAIVDSFNTLKSGVETLLNDTTIDAAKKNTNLVSLSKDLKAIVDLIVPAQSTLVPVNDTAALEAAAKKLKEQQEAAAAGAVDTKAGDAALQAITDSATLLKGYVEKQQQQQAAETQAKKFAQVLTDTVAKLEVAEEAKTTIMDTLKSRSFADEAAIVNSVDELMKVLNHGVVAERKRAEGIGGKGTGVMDIQVGPEHLKGVEYLVDQMAGYGYLASKKEDVLTGKNRSQMVQRILKIYDTIHGAQLQQERAQIMALMDATTTPADFQVPYTISRIVLAEVYADVFVENLTLFGPMEFKRDQVPITRYRREGGLASTQKTYKPSKRRIADIKTGEFTAMASGNLITDWFDIDATSSKLSAAFSDEFATLSKRTPNITGVGQGISNLILDLKRSLQQMVFNNMRDTALSYGSIPFTFTGSCDGTKSQFVVAADTSISTGEPFTVTLGGGTSFIYEYEVSNTGTVFYVLDGPNGTITLVDATGNPVTPGTALAPLAIVVTGKKATNETRFDLTACPSGTKWEEYLNGLLFAVTNKNAMQRQQRGYKPEFILASEVTSNYMTQAKAYEAMGARKQFGAPSAVGEGNYGFTGGLPHFGSDVFDDSYILLSQKDATIFRIFEPLVLKGPYPVRDTNGQLIGGDEYYIYQEDSLSSPINEKMSLVTVLS